MRYGRHGGADAGGKGADADGRRILDGRRSLGFLKASSGLVYKYGLGASVYQDWHSSELGYD